MITINFLAMLNYLLQLTLVWGALYLLYLLLLQRTTFFAYNRLYLLGGLVLGAVLPLHDWGTLFAHAAPLEQAGYYLQPITIGVQQVEIVVTEQAVKPATAESGFSWGQLLWWVYAIGLVLSAARLCYGGWQLSQLYRSSTKHKRLGYTLVKTPAVHTPFSFFRLLFWSDVLPCPSEDRDNILRHELAHIKGGHSVDVLFLEVLSALLWFHPLIYLYNRSLRTVHEYLADEAVLHDVQKKTYGHLLLRQSQTGQAVALANHFSHTQLKKRILMMTKKKSPRLQQIWYALALPLVAALAFAFSPSLVEAQALNPLMLTVLDNETQVPPIFPECEAEATVKLRQKCSDDKFLHFVLKNINSPKGVGGQGVIEFTVGKDGIAGSFKVRESSGDQAVADAVMKMLQSLPDLVPGKNKKGRIVETRLAFRFKLDRDTSEPSKATEAAGEVFKVVEEMPRFPGCEAETDTYIREKCAQQELLEFVYNNLQYPEEAKREGINGTVVAQFVVDKEGQVKNPKIVRSIGGGTDEAVLEVVNNMPEWIPGKQRGRLVNVQFNLPIRFQLPEETDTAEEKPSNSDGVLRVAEEMPRFPGCEDITDKLERHQCSNRRMLEFVYGSVKYPEDARNERIQGTGVIKLVIGKTGEVERYEIARSIHPSLDAEMDRIARLIQDEVQWIPARQDGEAVKVSFMLPIKFKLADDKDESKSLKIDAEDKPLFVIDGKRLPNFTSLDSLDDVVEPNDIESISVLKGEKAVEKYGEAGKNGVVEIKTKTGITKDPLRVIGYPSNDQDGNVAPTLPNAQPSQKLELSNFSATPNPTEGELQVRFEAAAAPTLLRVLDLTGKELLRRPLTQFQGGMAEETLDLSSLPSGMILLEVRQGERVYVERVMVK